MVASLIALGALLVGGALGWLVSRSAVKAPDPVQVALDKQKALEPVKQALHKADTPAKVADQWNEHFKP